MFNPLVTVVIPIYNVEKYLDRCVTSVVGQTYKNIEILLVDDGSPDGCPAMCDSWAEKDRRIRAIHKENQGLGMARNTGIDNALGEYILFFDSDDYVSVDTVEKCINSLKGKTDTVIFGLNEVYPDGRINGLRNNAEKGVYSDKEITEDLLPGLFIYKIGYGVSGCCKMFSMNIIKENNLRFRSEREVISEDAFFCLEYFSKATMVSVISDRLYYYYKNDKSLSRTFRADRQQKNNMFLSKCIDRIKELSLPSNTVNYVASRYHLYSIAAMKQILTSDLMKKDKKTELRKIYKDEFFRNTLNRDVISIDPRSIGIFMMLIKLRAYWACDFLLKLKV